MDTEITQPSKIKTINHVTFERLGVLDFKFENIIFTYAKSEEEQHKHHICLLKKFQIIICCSSGPRKMEKKTNLKILKSLIRQKSNYKNDVY